MVVGRIVACCALLGVAACSQQSAPPAPPPAVVGERLVVRLTQTPDLKPVAATVTTRDQAEARARIAGTLVRLNVKEGDLVHRGQVLGVVSDPRLTLETRAYDAQVGAAAAQSANAQAELARTRDLYEHGVYAKARLDQVTAQARAAAGALGAAQAQRGASAELAAQGAVLAPADGRVLRADVPAGSVVMPGQSIATLTAGPAVLRIEAPEAVAGSLKPGQSVQLATDRTGQTTSATIVQVYPSVTAGRIVADLDAPGLSGGPIGRRVAVRLALGERQAILVPTRFILSRSGVDFVRALKPGGGVEEVPVQLAAGAAPGEMEVLSGLAVGDTLVAPGPRR